MARLKFKKGILRVMSPILDQLGYSYVGYYPVGQGPFGSGLGAPDHLYYKKTLEEIASQCWIGFQLSQHALPPDREFTVDLMRAGYPDVTVINSTCKPIGTRLPQLLVFHFNVPVYVEGYGWWGEPPTEAEEPRSPVYLSMGHWWPFETQEEFEGQLSSVLRLLLKHGIPWLEEPESEMPPWGYIGPPPPGQSWDES